jgi:hypothetical protein
MKNLYALICSMILLVGSQVSMAYSAEVDHSDYSYSNDLLMEFYAPVPMAAPAGITCSDDVDLNSGTCDISATYVTPSDVEYCVSVTTFESGDWAETVSNGASWTVSPSNTVVTGTSAPSGSSGDHYYGTTITCEGVLSFDYGFTMTDVSGNNKNFCLRIYINGVSYDIATLTNTVANTPPSPTSGSYSIAVNAGDRIAFGTDKCDGNNTAGNVRISNLMLPTFVSITPSLVYGPLPGEAISFGLTEVAWEADPGMAYPEYYSSNDCGESWATALPISRLQDVMDDCPDGTTLYFEYGDYSVTTTFSIPGDKDLDFVGDVGNSTGPTAAWFMTTVTDISLFDLSETYTGSKTISFSNFDFSGTRQTLGDGGGFQIDPNGTAPSIDFTNCLFTNLWALGGGALYLNGGLVSFDGCTFSENRATNGCGGDISTGPSFNPGGTVSFVDCDFSDSQSTGNGGSMCMASPAAPLDAPPLTAPTLSYSSSVFTGLSAANGAAIYIDQGAYNSLSVTDCDFSFNSVTDDGGSIYAKDVDVLIDGCTFDSDEAGNEGGSVFITVTSGTKYVTVTSSTFENSVAAENGGGLALVGDDLDAIVYATSFDNCAANGVPTTNGYGGALYTQMTGDIWVDRCSFTGNDAPRGGAIMFRDDGDPGNAFGGIVSNSVFCSNTAGQGGAIRIWQNADVVDVVNCSFSGNTSATGGDVRIQAGTMNITNCILRSSGPISNGGTVNVSYSNINGGYTGTGNIDADPLFTDAGNCDLSVPASSSGIDLGDDGSVEGSLDYSGNARLNCVVDMGAYELGGSHSVSGVTITDPSCPTVPDGSIALSVSPASATYTYLWSNGGTNANLSDLFNGSYSVTVTREPSCESLVFGPYSLTSVDNILPNPICRNVTITLDDNGLATIDPNSVDDGSTDNCGIASLTLNQLNFDCADIGDIQLIFTVTDLSDNAASCYTTVTVKDETAPTFTCPGDQSENLDGDCEIVLSDYTALVVDEADNCSDPGNITITQSPTAGTSISLAHGGTQTVTIVATDENGNESSCVITVTANDVTAPVIACEGSFVSNMDANCVFTVPVISTTLTDCNASMVQSPAAGTTLTASHGDVIGVTVTATDDAGLIGACSTNITVQDVTTPVITCPSDQIATLNASCDLVYVDYTGMASVTDDCDVTITQDPAAGTTVTSVVHGDSYTVTLTATDLAGNNSSCTFTVTADANIPGIVCLSDQVVDLDGSCDLILPDYTTSVTVQLNCNSSGSITVTQNPAPGTYASFHGDEVYVTMTATDGASQTNTCSFKVTSNDATNPSITVCPPDVADFPLDGDCALIVPDYTNSVTATDNCSDLTVTQNPTASSAISLAHGDSYDITMTVMDAGGNVDNCVFSISVVDVTPPTMVCLGDQDVDLDDGCGLVYPDYTGMMNEDDNCGSAFVTVTQVPTAGTTVSSVVGATYNVTVTAEDPQGNTSVCIVPITMVDNTPPDMACKNVTVELDNAGLATVDPSLVDDGVTDNCALGTLALNQTSFDCDDLGDNGLIFTAEDLSGNTSNCFVTVTIVDVTPPSMDCPATQFVTVDNGCEFTLGDYTTSVTNVWDNCDAAFVTVTQSPAAGTTISSGHGVAYQVTMTATDGSGNSYDCVFDVQGVDDIPPTIACGEGQEVDLLDDCVLTFPDFSEDWVVDDNCAVDYVIQDPAFGTTLASSPGAEHSVTVTAYDFGGNMASCTYEITAVDNQPPTLICISGDELVLTDAISSCSVTIPDYTTSVTAVDNCSEVSITQEPEDGTVYFSSHGMTYTITVTATDASDNVSTCEFQVTAIDVDAPFITVCAPDMTVELDETCSLEVPDFSTSVSAEDNCTYTITQDPIAGAMLPSFDGEVWTVTITATDDAGLFDECFVNITAVDNTPPELTCPPDFTVDANDWCDLEIPDILVSVTASDNCGSVTLEQDPAPGTLFAAAHDGVFAVTITATDDAENTTSCVVEITVDDNIAPAVNGPADIILENDLLECGAIVDYSLGLTNDPTEIFLGVKSDEDLIYLINAEDGSVIRTQQVWATGYTIDGLNDVVRNSLTGVYYVLANVSGSPSTMLGTINLDSGEITLIGIMGDNFASMAFNRDGELYAITSDAGTNVSTIYQVNTTTAIPTLVMSMDDAFNTVGEVLAYNYNNDRFYRWSGNTLTPSVRYQMINVDATTVTDLTPVAVFTYEVTAAEYRNGEFYTINSNGEYASYDPLSSSYSTTTVTSASSYRGLRSGAIVDEAIAYWENCYGVTVTQTTGLPPGSQFPVGITTNTFEVEDAGGNLNTTSFDITVLDTEPPVMNCPPDQVVTLDPSPEFGCVLTYPFWATSATASDNCEIASIVQDPVAGTTIGTSHGSTYDVTITATDIYDNVNSCVFTITVSDITPPEITCPPDQLVNIEPDDGCTLIYPAFSYTATDNCVTYVTQNPAAGTTITTSHGAIYTVTFTVVDDANNMDVCYFDITANDVTDPEIICQAPQTVTITEADGCVLEFPAFSYTATDQCNVAEVIQDPAPGSTVTTSHGTIYTITITAYDDAGNWDACSFNITAVDVTPPDVICQEPQTVEIEDYEGCVLIYPEFAYTVTDNCVAYVTQDPAPGTTVTTAHGTVYTITITAVDDANNMDVCYFNITAIDVDAPNMFCQDIVITLDPDGTYTLTEEEIDNGSWDNCVIDDWWLSQYDFDCSDIDSYEWDGTYSYSTVTYSTLTMASPTYLTMTDDDITDLIPIGFNFEFYGVTYNTLRVSSNGFITFNQVNYSNGCCVGRTLPDSDPNFSTYIAFAHEDLDPGEAGSEIKFETIGFAPNRKWVLNFHTVPHFPNNNPVTSQLILHETTGVIEIQTTEMTHYSNGHTMGIQSYPDYTVVAGRNSQAWSAYNEGIVFEPNLALSPGSELTTVTLTAVDEAGNEAECSATVEVSFPEPVAICYPLRIVKLGPNGEVNILPNQLDSLSYSPPGSELTFTASQTLFDCNDLGEIEVTLTVTDVCGQYDVCTSTVRVIDTIIPTITCPADILVSNDLGECGAYVTFTDPQYDDNCPSTGVSPANIFFTTAGWGSGQFNVYKAPIDGSTVPVVLYGPGYGQPAPIDYDNNTGKIYWGGGNWWQIWRGSDDGLDVPYLLPNSTSGGNDRLGLSIDPANNRYFYSTPFGGGVWKANLDGTGSPTLIASVIWSSAIEYDATLDKLYFNGGTTYNGYNTIYSMNPDGTGQVVLFNSSDGVSNARGIVTDAANNKIYWVNKGTGEIWSGNLDGTGTPSALYSYPSTNARDIDLDKSSGTLYWTEFGGSDIIAYAPANGSGSRTVLYSGSYGSIRGLTLGNTGAGLNLAQTDDTGLSSGSFFPVGTTTIEYTVTDGSGNINTCSFNISVVDNEAPVITCPPDVTVGNDLDACGATLTVTMATALDNCTENVTVTQTGGPSSGDFVGLGTYTISFMAVDEYGNSSTCSYDITVEDQQAPDAVCNDITVYLLGPSGGTSVPLSALDGGSSDNCGPVTITSPNSPLNFDCDDLGVNPITLVVTDVHNLQSTCIANVNVVDTMMPVISCMDATLQLDALGDATLTVNDVLASAWDNCSVTDVQLSQYDFNCSHVGDNDVVVTVFDQSGNYRQCTATVTIEDNVPPVALCKNITVQLDASGNASITPSMIDDGSNDACGIASLVASQTSFDCDDVGDVIVTLTVTDVNGNSSTCTSTVTVEDNVAPTALCQNVTVQLDASGMASITASQINNGSSDACGIASLAVSPYSFDCDDLGSNMVTLTVTDVNGNSSTCTAYVTVEDNIDPVGVAPAPMSYSNDLGDCGADVTVSLLSATDNCSVTSVSNDYTTGGWDASGFYPVGSTTVTWTITDQSGNSSTASTTIVVTDLEAPAPTCYNMTVTNDADDCGAWVTMTPATGVDNCPGPITVSHDQATNAAGQAYFAVGGPHAVVWTVSDQYGNSTTCTAYITVEDNQAPTALCQDRVVVLDDQGMGSVDITGNGNNIDIGSFDNCGIDYMTLSQQNFDCDDVGTHDVILTVYDIHGNSSTCLSEVTVRDTTRPFVTCQDITLTLDASGNASIGVSDVLWTVSDNCGIQSTWIEDGSFGCADVGTNLIWVWAEDVNGNRDSCQAQVTVIDATAPVVDCKDITVQLDATGNVSITPDMVDDGSYDACSSVTMTVSPSSFDCTNIGDNTVVLTVMDAEGNTSTCTAVVTVQDLIAPVLSCPSNIEVNADQGTCSTVVSWNPATATDNCDAQLTVVQTGGPASGSSFPVGTTTITYTATDASGNVGTCSFDIIVHDYQPPVMTSCPQDIFVSTDPGDCGALVSWAIPTASDNCPGVTVTQLSGPANGSFIAPGTHTVVYVATDASGNTATCSFDVEVQDDEAPIVTTQCPIAHYFTTLPSVCGAYATFDPPAATDNCGIASVVRIDTHPYNSGDLFPVGLTILEYQITDVHGNFTTCAVWIQVDDVTPPTATCPSNMTAIADAGECGTDVTYNLPTGSDLCSNVTVTLVSGLGSGANFPVGNNTETYAITDEAGNTTTCSFVITVVDDEDPVISCPADQTVATATGNCNGILQWPAPTATDNCPGVTVSQTDGPAMGSSLPVGTYTIEYTASDASGNTAVCSFTVTVEDQQAPLMTCPSDIQLNADANCEAVPTWSAPSATDNCGSVTVVQTSGPSSGSTVSSGTYTVEYTATDAAGNSTVCSFNILVVGGGTPSITCASDIVVGTDAGDCSAVVTYADPVATGGCGAAAYTQIAGLPSGSSFPLGTTTNTFVAFTSTGDTDTCSFTVTVNDNEAPSLDCPSDMNLTVDQNCEAVAMWTAPTATDACSNVTVVQTSGPTSPAILGAGTYTVVYTATDAAGNSSTCSFDITVVDNTAPVISCNADMTVGTSATACGANVTWTVPTATDNCSGVTLVQTSGPANGSLLPLGTTTIEYTATDASGNTAVCSFDITVVDDVAPAVSCPSDIVISADAGMCSAVVSYVVPTGTDNCSGVTTTLTSGLGSGSAFPIGTTTETYTVVDAAGNTTVCSFTITVEDNEAPSITCPSDIVVNNDAGVCGAVVTYSAPQGTDNCPGTSTSLIAGLTSGSTFPIGVTTVTYEVTDAAGNTAQCSFTVTVNDIVAPSITCPADITMNSDNGVCGAVVQYTAPVVTDDCSSPTVTMTGGLASGSTFPVGTTTVTYVATDGSGNSSSCSFTVTVLDNEAPQIVCPQNITMFATAGQCGTAVTFNLPTIVSDNCGDAVITQTAGPASGSVFAPGTTVVEFTATDAAGNSSTCSFDVIVIDNIAPTLSCPADITVGNDAGQCGANVTYNTPVGVDDCPGTTTTLISGLPSGSYFATGTHTITYEATDAAGNTTQCSFTITVEDMEDPVISCPSDVTTTSPITACGAIVTYASPTFTDNCPGATMTQIAGPVSGGLFPVGTTVVTYQVTDAAGNTAQCSFNVEVTYVDSIPIVGDTVACGSITLGAPIQGATYEWSTGQTTPQIVVTQSGTYSLTLTNNSGCSASGSIDVTVNANPTVSISGVPTNTICVYHSSFNLTGSPAGGTFSGPGMTGNTFDPATAGIGFHQVTYNYTDANGCSGSDQVVIQVDGCVSVGEPIVFGQSLDVYPNPFSNYIDVAFTTIEGGDVQLRLTNMLGQVVLDRTVTAQAGENVLRLDIAEDLANGIYYLNIEYAGETWVEKLVTED